MKRFLDFNKRDDDLQIVYESVETVVEPSKPEIIEKVIETKEITEVVTLPGTPGVMGPVQQ